MAMSPGVPMGYTYLNLLDSPVLLQILTTLATVMVPGRFARESFRPWVVSPLFGGSFRPCFLLKHQGLSQAMFRDIYGGLDFSTIIFR